MNSKFLIFSIVVTALLSACAYAPAHKTTPGPDGQVLLLAPAFAGEDNAITQSSEGGHYRVSLWSIDAPVVLNQIQDWKVRVTDKAGNAVTDAKVRIHGGMPVHQHDFPTRPRVTKSVGDGLYMIEGVKFSMPGFWQIRINIREADIRRDRAIFNLSL